MVGNFNVFNYFHSLYTLPNEITQFHSPKQYSLEMKSQAIPSLF